MINQKMGFYSAKTKSRRWTIVSLAYLLDTIHVNVYNIYAMNNGLDLKKQNIFDFRFQLAKLVVTSQIIRRPRNGLTSVILTKISFFMQKKEIIRNSDVFQYSKTMEGRKRCRLCPMNIQGENQKLKKKQIEKSCCTMPKMWWSCL